jgi:putative oxidoreductase
VHVRSAIPAGSRRTLASQIKKDEGTLDTFFDRLGAYRPQLLSILRIVTALLFLQHATLKLFAFPPSEMPSPAVFSMFWFIGVFELVGSLALIAGFWTRLAAFILSGEMAVAYWMAHAPQSVFPIANFGESAVLFCFVFLYIAAAGPGAWAFDNMRRPAMA